MSNFEQTPRGQPPRQRSGCVTAFMLVAGVILLIPGILCAIINAKMSGSGADPFTGVVMLIALGGLGLIVFAFTRK